MENSNLQLTCDENTFTVTDKISKQAVVIPWQSIALHFAGQIINPGTMTVEKTGTGYSCQATNGDIAFAVQINLPKDKQWCTLQTTITNNGSALATPETVIMAESDSIAFTPVGYKHQNAYRNEEKNPFTSQDGEEASGGIIPGCGYPIFCDDLFVGIEHVAAFTLAKKEGFTCKHYPVWDSNNQIVMPAIVIGSKADFPTTAKSFHCHPMALEKLKYCR